MMRAMKKPLVIAALLASSAAAQPPQGGLGVSIKAGALVSSESDLDEGGSSEVNRWDVEAGYRIFRSDTFSARLSVGLEGRDYSFSSGSGALADLPDDALQRRLGLGLFGEVNKDWGWMLTPAVRWSTLGDADAEDGTDFRGLALATRRFGERFALSFGALARTRLEDSPWFFPIVGIDWRITDRLRLRTSDEIGLGYTLDEAGRWSIDALFVPREWEYRIEARDDASSEGVFSDERLMGWLVTSYRPNPGVTVRGIIGTSFTEEYRIEDRDGHRIAETDGDPPIHIGFDLGVRL
jgi:hypothetical protein